MFLPVGDHHLHVVDLGAGAPLLLHSGWVASWDHWIELVQRLHHRWRCVAYDHRGAGASTFPAEAISAEGLADDVLRVLDALGLDRVVLVGESLGAIPCVQAALRAPERVRGLVLIGGMPASPRGGPGPFPGFVRADFLGTMTAFARTCVPEPEFQHLLDLGAQMLTRRDAESAARLLEAHAEAGSAPDLTAVRVPTLVIHGELDAIVPIKVARRVAEAIPGARLVELEGVGHVPALTRPDRVAAEIEAWAATLPA